MKKNILLIITLAFLNACAEYSSFLGPSYTMVKTGNVAAVSNSVAASYGFKRVTGESPETLANTFLLEGKNLRECQTIHSSNLNEIFFNTLDDIDCYQDPFSILR